MKHYNSGKFCQILECQANRHERKATFWRLSGDSSDASQIIATDQVKTIAYFKFATT